MDLLRDPLRFVQEQSVKLTPERLAQGFRAQLKAATSLPDKMADLLTSLFGTVGFLILNGIFFGGWVLWNTGYFGYEPFDPFPFNLLTTIVSLEAIALSVIVLMSQNRQSRVADLRQKMDFEIDVRAEGEITKILELLAELHKKAGLGKKDKELQEMLEKTDLQKLEEEVKSRQS
ncbi:hypothetical protein A3A39_00855 [Candidatus Kaiserbacteria bacterium RIFCSPLOWO2_01_FULL_54_13]|uniref:DUF1003 domain-containing protein n=1 Tax=Candidatus Kaiserbacteria bacterium RIFCSPLOWO2_01_FULL_54_13 TaxID=1798512 RepID=A0A1F6F0Z6_9BACT|nr:MAG: hypothetical protein A3A39_00855 [Candidatus Kaiserbacteria bacterium RIFCSPLOWO2_01_FULL_54_13]